MGFSVFLLMLRIILLCLLAYFGLGYGCIRLYETMTFYVPFSKELAANNVYNKSTQRKLIKGYAMPFVCLVLIALALTVVLVIFTPFGILVAIACFVAGLIVYYRELPSKKALIRLFCHRYRRQMDEKQLNAFLQNRYNMTLDEQVVRSK